MKDNLKMLGALLGVVLLIMALTYGFGWFGVGYKKTVGKASQNADREVFEQTNSFTKAKRQEIIKSYKEWNDCEDTDCREAIEYVLSLSIADFDEDKFIKDRKLLLWVKQIKQ